jgi:hypothetical protein
MKIRWSSLSSAPHFQIELSIHGSNCNSRFVSMSELELFLLTGALTQNFNTVDLVSFLEKSKKLNTKIVAVTLKVTSYKTMSKKKSEKVKNQDSMRKLNFFLSTLPFSPWVVSTTWLYVRAPQKIQEKNELNTRFQQSTKIHHKLIQSRNWMCLVFNM